MLLKSMGTFGSTAAKFLPMQTFPSSWRFVRVLRTSKMVGSTAEIWLDARVSPRSCDWGLKAPTLSRVKLLPRILNVQRSWLCSNAFSSKSVIWLKSALNTVSLIRGLRVAGLITFRRLLSMRSDSMLTLSANKSACSSPSRFPDKLTSTSFRNPLNVRRGKLLITFSANDTRCKLVIGENKFSSTSWIEFESSRKSQTFPNDANAFGCIDVIAFWCIWRTSRAINGSSNNASIELKLLLLRLRVCSDFACSKKSLGNCMRLLNDNCKLSNCWALSGSLFDSDCRRLSRRLRDFRFPNRASMSKLKFLISFESKFKCSSWSTPAKASSSIWEMILACESILRRSWHASKALAGSRSNALSNKFIVLSWLQLKKVPSLITPSGRSASLRARGLQTFWKSLLGWNSWWMVGH